MRLVFPFVLDSVPGVDGGALWLQRERFALVARTSPAGGVVRLVAGEETRSREAGQDAEMAARHLVARHLVVSRAALEGCAAIGPGCVEQRSHGESAFGGEYTLSG
ncbi:hypothetical protein RBB79_01325 [Tunturiibacter empetritectus]|uniref:Uncharacterized protein n=1 Tax=Tunturiibacter lichenicola TaxID=2051959 RepID=A0A852V9Y8_9BACT|nr:hypothetical protein [Edaphobacter lichenicola]NYF88131.1 hypothetical protein [Edaphobacter lichenicola]